jgi:N-acetyl-1-D-myo-inositol-2-amino-2-deoxy-alpha-D-glucopyranoside deacetylase
MRLLVVVAHPDDESFGCGSVLLHARASGYETSVLCATRGEAGESRVPIDDLASVREAELRAAARLLGVTTVAILGYRDSGMDGPLASDSLAAAEPSALADDIAAVIDELRPDVVVTLDASDGHRDHRVIRDATLAAVERADHSPAATYLCCLARSSMARWADQMRASGGGDMYLSMGELGTPDEEITTVIDVRHHLAQRWASIRAHASQASPYDDLDESLAEEFLGRDRLRLVAGADLLSAG